MNRRPMPGKPRASPGTRPSPDPLPVRPAETDAWSTLDAELAAWCDAGRRATLWLRDDDATADSPALRRLIDLAGARAVPVALAVVPAAVEGSLVAAVSRAQRVTVVQHGYAHRNHAPAGARKAELGVHRSPDTVLGELRQGRDALARRFGDRFAPILVPPWNRIAPGLVVRLPGIGVRGLSTFGPRTSVHPAAGLTQGNTHVDPVAWHAGRGFVGTEAAVAQLVDHLRARREGRVDATEPTGILTHHLVFDEDGWTFVAEVLARTLASGTVEWQGVANVFALAM